MAQAGVPETTIAQLTATSARKAELTGVVERYVASYRERDVDARVALFAEDLVFEDPASVVHATDRRSLRQFYEGLEANGYDLDFTVHGVVACGPSALARTTARVTLAGSGAFALDVTVLFTVDAAGRITALRSYFDLDGILA